MEPNRNPSKCVSGWWLSLSDDEQALFCEGLTEAEYEPSATGLKNFLLDLFTGKLEEPEPAETPTDRVLNGLGEFIVKNPDEVRRYAAVAGAAINGLFNKKGRS